MGLVDWEEVLSILLAQELSTVYDPISQLDMGSCPERFLRANVRLP
jgi:hypothetical protein